MNLKRIKKVSEIKLEGVTIDAEYHETNLHSVTITDSKGSLVKISKTDYSEIGMFVTAPPTKVKKWAVTGKLMGIAEINETFDDQFTAGNRKSEIEKQLDYSDKAGIEVKEIEVEEAF